MRYSLLGNFCSATCQELKSLAFGNISSDNFHLILWNFK
jgi:hypothetical protein